MRFALLARMRTTDSPIVPEYHRQVQRHYGKTGTYGKTGMEKRGHSAFRRVRRIPIGLSDRSMRRSTRQGVAENIPGHGSQMADCNRGFLCNWRPRCEDHSGCTVRQSAPPGRSSPPRAEDFLRVRTRGIRMISTATDRAAAVWRPQRIRTASGAGAHTHAAAADAGAAPSKSAAAAMAITLRIFRVLQIQQSTPLNRLLTVIFRRVYPAEAFGINPG